MTEDQIAIRYAKKFEVLNDVMIRLPASFVLLFKDSVRLLISTAVKLDEGKGQILHFFLPFTSLWSI